LEIAAGDLGNRIYQMNWTLAKYQVDFETEYGTAPESQTVTYGEKVTKPTAPTVASHEFQYWQTADSKPWDFENSTVSNSLTLTAVWQPKNFVANFYNGSTFFSSTFVAYGSSIETPSITPEKEGHTFLHWALTEGGDKFNFETETMPANDVNLYAQWEKNKYMVYLPKGMNFVENTVSANASGEIVAEFEYGENVSFKLDNGYILQEGSSIKYHT
jgi:uncharacterized repeat protein (TIGR02543 family)